MSSLAERVLYGLRFFTDREIRISLEQSAGGGFTDADCARRALAAYATATLEERNEMIFCLEDQQALEVEKALHKARDKVRQFIDQSFTGKGKAYALEHIARHPHVHPAEWVSGVTALYELFEAHPEVSPATEAETLSKAAMAECTGHTTLPSRPVAEGLTPLLDFSEQRPLDRSPGKAAVHNAFVRACLPLIPPWVETMEDVPAEKLGVPKPTPMAEESTSAAVFEVEVARLAAQETGPRGRALRRLEERKEREEREREQTHFPN